MKIEINPWGQNDVKDYDKLSQEFGIKPFDPLLKKIKEPHLVMRRGVVFGHRDFDKVLDARKNGKSYAMMTGLMPSGKFHLGHKILAEQIIYHQQVLGGKVFLCVADIEAYNMRMNDMEKLRETAINEYLLNYIALGLKPSNCDFYFQSARSNDPDQSNAYYRLAGMSARKTTFNEMKAIYGEISPAKVMSVMTQVSDIIHPMLPEFGGYNNVVVPVGVDQDPHMRLTRDIASRFNEREYKLPSLPGSTYHRFIKGLKGGKMSSSDEFSYIALTDDPATAKKKINKYAFSGGRETIEEHRKKGGVPEIDVSYQYLYTQFEPSDKKIKQIYDDYKSGKLLSGELKAILIEKIQTFLKDHQRKREKAKKQVDKFLK
ncbi:MAG: tryptophan--tRNA ligase [Candidatus Aenigmarchaeota archaeon]|nr:tryptophan--tRNA ligase [Candidatus Aenigmarchaeota archaeon]